MNLNNDRMKAKIIRSDIKKEFYTEEGCYILKLWNHEKDASASIARARVKPGITTQLHLLSGIIERYLITKGKGIVKVNDSDPEVVSIGDVVIIPENTPQQITNTGDEDLIFYCICTPRFTPNRYKTLEQKNDF